MKKLLVFLGLSIVGLFQAVSAQDTITVELSSKAKLVIYTKDKEGLKMIRNLDLNQIIRDATKSLDTSNIQNPAQTKVYEYEFDSNRRELNLRNETNITSDLPDTVRRSSFTYNNNEERYRYRNRRYRLFWSVDLGLNNYLSNGQFPDTDGSAYAVTPLASRYFGVGTYQRTRIGGSKSPFSIQVGVELNFYNFAFSDNRYIKKLDDKVDFPDYLVDFGQELRKSKLTVTYLNLPLTITARLRDQYGRRTFNFGVGGYVGYRLDAYAKRKVGNNPNRQHSNFYLNNWRYGVEGQIGYRDFLLFARYDLNELFATDRGPQLNAFTLGVRL